MVGSTGDLFPLRPATKTPKTMFSDLNPQQKLDYLRANKTWDLPFGLAQLKQALIHRNPLAVSIFPNRLNDYFEIVKIL